MPRSIRRPSLTVGLDDVGEAVDLVGQRAVRVDIDREEVCRRTHGVFLARFDQIDHCLFARVQEQFAAEAVTCMAICCSGYLAEVSTSEAEVLRFLYPV